MRAAAPPPKLTISEWADRYRKLSPEASAEPGQWMTARAEYQRGIMDAICDAGVDSVVVMSSAQVGKTEVLNNAVGFYVSQDPAPILVLQPTLDMAETWSKDRLAPMVRDTPALRSMIADPRARDSGNTLLHKRFNGGHITMVGANSASGLASRPIRCVFADEVDRYPSSAGTEGDPVSLAVKRTTTFWNRKIVLLSTPTVKGESRIEAAYLESDQRRFLVPCPDCGEEQRLVWSQVRWAEGEPSTAEYACHECGSLWNDAQRWSAVRRGRWDASREFRGIAGFHLSELYSPWTKLSDTVGAFLSAKSSPDRLRTWINTSLGETWEDRGESVDAHVLSRLAEPYGPDDLPAAVQLATAGVDTQGDRLEVEILGWGDEEESFGIAYHVLYGNPALPEVWADLDALLLETYQTEDGRTIRVQSACIDSGGHHAEQVLRFCRERFRRRVYAIKGQGGAGRPIWPMRASKTKTKDQVFMVGVDTGKDTVYARFRLDEPGPGYCHLPADPSSGYDATWCEQVTAEQKMTRFRMGRPEPVWELPKGKRNEALDCRVYATAALKALPANVRRSVVREPAPGPAVKKRRSVGGLAGGDWLGDRGSWL